MSGASISLEVSGIRALEGMMASIAHVDTLPLMERIVTVGEDSVSSNFEGEHDPAGIPWLPSHRALSEGGKTLTDHGILAGSIEGHASADHAEVGTNMVYARIHNEGGKIKRERSFAGFADIGFVEIDMPKRQFLGWGADALEEVEAQGEDWLASLLPAGALS
jgi:phage gpG-like protein